MEFKFKIGDIIRKISNPQEKFKVLQIGPFYNEQEIQVEMSDLKRDLYYHGDLKTVEDEFELVSKCEYDMGGDLPNTQEALKSEVEKQFLESHQINKSEDTVSATGSLRKNSGKPEISQLDPQFLLAIAEHMTKSSKKYPKYNWALGQEFHTPYDSLQRHLMAFMSGEDFDPESGTSHIISAAANLMIMYRSFLINQNNLELNLDTRFEGFSKIKKD